MIGIIVKIGMIGKIRMIEKIKVIPKLHFFDILLKAVYIIKFFTRLIMAKPKYKATIQLFESFQLFLNHFNP